MYGGQGHYKSCFSKFVAIYDFSNATCARLSKSTPLLIKFLTIQSGCDKFLVRLVLHKGNIPLGSVASINGVDIQF